MKKQIKKITLSKETLRHLSEREPEGVVGGVRTAACSGGTSSCCTDTCGMICTKLC